MKWERKDVRRRCLRCIMATRFFVLPVTKKSDTSNTETPNPTKLTTRITTRIYRSNVTSASTSSHPNTTRKSIGRCITDLIIATSKEAISLSFQIPIISGATPVPSDSLLHSCLRSSCTPLCLSIRDHIIPPSSLLKSLLFRPVALELRGPFSDPFSSTTITSQTGSGVPLMQEAWSSGSTGSVVFNGGLPSLVRGQHLKLICSCRVGPGSVSAVRSCLCSLLFRLGICGYSTKKVHSSDVMARNTYLTKELSCEAGQLMHAGMVFVKPGAIYPILTDNVGKRTGSISDDWDIFRAEQMKDPEPKKGYDDIPKEIPDPDAKKPDDWDDGECTAPTIPNPEYKGPWKQKLKTGTLFDNFLICDDPEYAKKFAEEIWGMTKDAEKASFQEAEKKKEEEESKYDDEDNASDDDADDDTCADECNSKTESVEEKKEAEHVGL